MVTGHETASVWNARKGQAQSVTGRLHPLPELPPSVVDALAADSRYAKARLFHRGRRWWIHYSPDLLTGPFPSKREAVAWLTTGGR